MKHKLLILFVALICATQLFGYPLNYYLTLYNNPYRTNTAIVVGCDKNYSGRVDIPYEVKDEGGNRYNVIGIGAYAFGRCSKLTLITIPYSVTTIGDHAFYACLGLTSVTISNSVTTIENDAFYGCDNLGRTNYTGTIADWCKIKFNNYVANPTFYSHNFYINDVEVKDLIIPESVTTIGDYAFYNCKGLTSVTIGNSVKTIGGSVFSNCSGLTKTNYIGSIADWCKIKFGSSTSNPMHYSHNFFINDVEIKNLVIPDGVDTIGNYAFRTCKGLTSVTIGNSVKTIGEEAFCWCEGLISITIPNSVKTIGRFAFSSCNGLIKTNYTGTIADWCKIKFGSSTSNPIGYSENFFLNNVEVKDLVIPDGVDTIGNYAFRTCKGLTSVTIGNSVKTIGEEAFFGCSGLTSVTIGNSVTTIGENAFCMCDRLTSVAIPNSVTTIEKSAFNSCLLRSIDIPNSVTTIGEAAFRYCHLIISVTIGNSVTTIGENAFARCENVQQITCYAAIPPKCGLDCFYDVDKSIPLYVPAKSVNAYKTADEWKEFTNILSIGAEEVPVTEPIITPDNHSVTITWPQTDNADTYTLEIRKSGDLICTFTFNSQGTITNIAFDAPARGGERTASNVELTTNGYKFTVTGLEPGTEYTYTITAKNTSAQPIKTYSGNFTTTGTTGLENLTIDKTGGNKFIYGNQLYLRHSNKLYNAVGGLMK